MSDIIFHDEYRRDWMRAFPLGNGRLGAMVYGDPNIETLEINEESLWSGRRLEERYSHDLNDLARIRELLFAEKYEEATSLCTDTLLASPPRVRSFESFGELIIDHFDKSDFTDYKKVLDLSKAIVSVSYKKGDVEYKSESFISEKYDCLIHRIRSFGGNLSCKVTFKRGRDAITISPDSKTITLDGQVICPAHEYYGEEFDGMKFGAKIRLFSDGEMSSDGVHVTIKNATDLTIYGSFSTTYDINKHDFDNSIDYQRKNSEIIDALVGVDYEFIKEEHVTSHRLRYDLVNFSLDCNDYSGIPTDKRLKRVIEDGFDDFDLYCLYYNFGRYLLIESSGKNASLPANLQGIWCNGFDPPWGSDYHTNINLQMNYWCADNTNISESFRAFSNYVGSLCRFGRDTAKKLFGARGWVCNHTSDIFGRTGVHDSVSCGFFPMAAPWLCFNLFEHYEYTSSIEYLEEIYPILKGVCEFLLDFMVERDGFLLTAPSNSPENMFFYNDGDEKKASMFTYGATIDFEIIRAIFTRTIFACERLDLDTELAEELKGALSKLPPLRISERYGTICEWIKDYEEAEPGHRHISHLFGLYPDDSINESDPILFEAAKKTIERRLSHGGAGTGWSRAWVINFYSRLKDGRNAEKHLKKLLELSTAENLFDMHPPFQIDGNFGAVAGITEMLLQSHGGTPENRIIELLPALPDNWKNGHISGIKARGGFVFDIYWSRSRITRVKITAESDGTLRLKLPSLDFKTEKRFETKDGVFASVFSSNESVEIEFC